MSLRTCPLALILIPLLAASACESSGAQPSVTPDAAAGGEPDATQPSDVGTIDGAPSGADAAAPDAGEDVSLDRDAAGDAGDEGVVDAEISDDARDAPVLADATDTASTDAADASDAGARPS